MEITINLKTPVEVNFDKDETFKNFYKYPTMNWFGAGVSWARILEAKLLLSNCTNRICHIYGIENKHFRVPDKSYIKYQFKEEDCDRYYHTIIEEDDFPLVEFNIASEYYYPYWVNLKELVILENKK